MRHFSGYFLLFFVVALVWVLDNPVSTLGLPAIGRLLDPVRGCWANAEPFKADFNEQHALEGLQQKGGIYFDNRLVPHIEAGNDHDLYYLQGYTHARFRLWQMDMQTRAAAGRISEIVGKKALGFDRLQRRKGMTFAAERSLEAMERVPETKMMLGAYAEGVNAYIASLSFKDYPLEYKLMGFVPEPWTTLKSALLLKYMADDLTGATDDIGLTYLKEVLPTAIFQLLYPGKITNSATVIPSSTTFPNPTMQQPSVPTGSVFPEFTRKDFTATHEEGIGSNNWVVSGKRTGSGAAILCNDPHLGLNLPSLWYEAQLKAPGINVYGVSLPGAPGIIIGFNDSISWGLTNNYRDVKDYYLLKRAPNDKLKYVLDTATPALEPRVEHILVRNGKEFLDTVYYSVQGPVQYDENYPSPGGLRKPLAMAWMAHRATNELLAVYLLNRATNYTQFEDAIVHFECPAQNFAFADRSGNIAMWGQGQFVNKWKGQGTYIMDGSVKETMWGSLIPPHENPHVYNPEQGYLFSANECVTDSTYPYWYNGSFREYRAWRIHQVLDTLRNAGVQDMFNLQKDTYSLLAARALPIMLRHMNQPRKKLEANLLATLPQWNYCLDANSIQASIFQVWWFFLYNKIWAGFRDVPDMLYPSSERTLQLFEEADHGVVRVKELNNLDTLVVSSWNRAMDSLGRGAKRGLEWYKVKHTTLAHLTKIPAFGFSDMETGGWSNTVNAITSDHGPSWRMVVQMGKQIEAYGIYPGGQSGNPGSWYYSNFVKDWVAGKYNTIRFFPAEKYSASPAIKYTWTFQK